MRSSPRGDKHRRLLLFSLVIQSLCLSRQPNEVIYAPSLVEVDALCIRMSWAHFKAQKLQGVLLYGRHWELRGEENIRLWETERSKGSSTNSETEIKTECRVLFLQNTLNSAHNDDHVLFEVYGQIKKLRAAQMLISPTYTYIFMRTWRCWTLQHSTRPTTGLVVCLEAPERLVVSQKDFAP